MAKTIMISDRAYRALQRRKKEGESFTDLILREFPEGNAGEILAIVKSMKPDLELSESMRRASQEFRKNFKLRRFDLK